MKAGEDVAAVVHDDAAAEAVGRAVGGGRGRRIRGLNQDEGRLDVGKHLLRHRGRGCLRCERLGDALANVSAGEGRRTGERHPVDDERDESRKHAGAEQAKAPDTPAR